MIRLVFAFLATGLAWAQAPQTNRLGAGPWDYTTYEKNTKIHVTAVARGLSHPWGIAFLPGGDMILTERPGRVRLIRKGALMAEPVKGIEALGKIDQLFDIALHPNFATNHYVYLTYIKPGTRPNLSLIHI